MVVDRFLSKNKSWLEGEDIQFKVCIHRPCPSSSSEGGLFQGRPKKNVEDTSFKTKKRRVEDLVQLRSASELTTAAEVV